MPRARLLAVAMLGLPSLACSLAPSAASKHFATASLPHSSEPAHSALHNVHSLTPRLISGGVPDSPAAFDELKARGIKTIISVDGAAPDLAAASSRGMRYVHIPITYAEVTELQRLEIARAIRDLPGPVFIHCHHGKHRGPAAASAAAVALGMITPKQGIEFMRITGTAPNYKGLYACVAAATTATAADLDAAPADFPAVRKPAGILAAMVRADEAFESLMAVKDAGWLVPKDHPDLVPAALAGQLADHLRVSGEDPKSRAHGSDYLDKLRAAIMAAALLEDAILAAAPADQLSARLNLVQASCKDCHAAYRDLRP
ncbi:MAG: hypothetical protein ACKVW3_18045 [Phycisphaerales bacterium]